MTDFLQRYPRELELKDGPLSLSLLTDPADAEVQSFTESLPDLDLLFLSRDIQEPKVLAAWKQSIAAGDIVSVVARRGETVLGTTAVVTDRYSWSPHVGELRVLVAPSARATGLGRQLIQESFLIGLDLGLEKLTVRMTLDQEGAIAVFEELGFRTEAHFRDHVKDRNGNNHDLLVMSHDVERFQAQMAAYGLDQIGK